MAADKRARKKEARDRAVAQREEELRRRRLARLLGIGLILVAVLVWAFVSGGDDGSGNGSGSGDSTAAGDQAAEETSAIACDGPEPPEANAQQYDSPPPLELEQGVDYRAVIETSCGTIEMDLLEDKAPQTVANFVFLAREGFYDGLTWHRIERNFVVQTGDPDGQNGVEPDGPGYFIPDEFPDKSKEYVFGTVGMANAGPGTTGSQFFVIVHDPEGGEPAGLQPFYTLFAEVDESSYEVLDKLSTLETVGGNDPVEASKPMDPAYINSIEIVEG